MKKIGRFILALFRGFPHQTSQDFKEKNTQKKSLSCLKKTPDHSKTENRDGTEQQQVREQPKPEVVSKTEDKKLHYWKQVLEENNPSHPEYQKAFEEVLREITSLEDIDWLHDTIGDDSPLVPDLMAKLETCREDFDTWIEVYSNRNELDQFSNFLIAKAISLASTTEEWISLWEAAENSHDDDLEKVKVALAQTGWSQEKWESLRNDTDNDNIENFAFIQLLEFKQTAPDIVSFYLEYEDNWITDEGVVKKTFEKLFSLTTRQEAKLISALAQDDNLKEAADKFLMS